MSRMHLIARLVLTALGVYTLVLGLNYGGLVGRVGPGWAGGLSCLGICLLFSVIASRLLLCPDAWVGRMVGPDDESELPVSHIHVLAGLRVVLLFCGLIVLAAHIGFLLRAGAFLAVGPKIIVNMIVYEYIDKHFYMPVSFWARLITDLCEAALGIYLVLGAPRFVRWQIDEFYPQTPVQGEV